MQEPSLRAAAAPAAGSQLLHCCDTGPCPYISWPEAVTGSLLTQGGWDAPSHPVGSHQLGAALPTTTLRRARCPQDGQDGATEARDMQQSCARGPLLPGPASPQPSERARWREPATSQLCRQGVCAGTIWEGQWNPQTFRSPQRSPWIQSAARLGERDGRGTE